MSSIQELETLIKENPANRKSEMCQMKKYKSLKEFNIEPIKLRSPTVKTFREADIDQDMMLQYRGTVKSSMAAGS